jgi:hypothetical protein
MLPRFAGQFAMTERAVLVLLLQKAGLRPSAAEIKSREIVTLYGSELAAVRAAACSKLSRIPREASRPPRPQPTPQGAVSIDSIVAQAVRDAPADLFMAPTPRRGGASAPGSSSKLALSRARGEEASTRGEPSAPPPPPLPSVAPAPAALNFSLTKARSPRKDPGIWREVVALDQELAKASVVTERARYEQVSVKMRNDLDAQVAERRATAEAERVRALAERAAVDAAEKAHYSEQRAAAAAKVAAAELAARKNIEFGLQEKARKEAETKKKWAEEAAAIRAQEALIEKAEAHAAVVKAREKETLLASARMNEEVIAARKARLAEEQAAEMKAAREAVEAMDRREAARLAELAAKEAALKAKLNAMGNVYAAKMENDRLAELRAEEERLRGERARDAEEVARAQRKRDFEASIKKEVAAQLTEKAARAEAERALNREARRRAEDLAAAAERDAAEEKRRAQARAVQYASQLDTLVAAKSAELAVPDDTPLERAFASSFLSKTKASLQQGKVPLTL